MIGGNLAFEMGYEQQSNQILGWKFPLAQGQVWGKVQGMFWGQVWEMGQGMVWGLVQEWSIYYYI